MHNASELAETGSIQRWMQAVVTDPQGVAAGIVSDEARAEFDLVPESVDTVVGRSAALSSLERLGVYANAYYARLLECLREEFPALVHALGEDTFNGFAFGYLQEHSPCSYTLANLARDFPQHLVQTRPRRETAAPDWADFLVDLATLERAYGEIFDGPGVEGQETLRPKNLRSISPDQWPDCRLIPVPCLRLLSLDFPVHEYAAAVHRGEKPDFPRPRRTCLVVTRRDYIIRRFSADEAEYALLAHLVAGAAVGEVIARAAESVAWGEPADLADRIREWFEGWARAGLFLCAEHGGPPRQ